MIKCTQSYNDLTFKVGRKYLYLYEGRRKIKMIRKMEIIPRIRSKLDYIEQTLTTHKGFEITKAIASIIEYERMI